MREGKKASFFFLAPVALGSLSFFSLSPLLSQKRHTSEKTRRRPPAGASGLPWRGHAGPPEARAGWAGHLPSLSLPPPSSSDRGRRERQQDLLLLLVLLLPPLSPSPSHPRAAPRTRERDKRRKIPYWALTERAKRKGERKKTKEKGRKKRKEGRATASRRFSKIRCSFSFLLFFVFFFYTSATHSSARSSLAAAYRIAYVSPSRSSTVLEPSGSTSTVPRVLSFFRFHFHFHFLRGKVSFSGLFFLPLARGMQKRKKKKKPHPCPPGRARRRGRPGWGR